MKIPPTNDGSSLGPFQQIANGAWGTAEERLDPHHSAAAFIRAAERIEGRLLRRGRARAGGAGLRVPGSLRPARRPGGGAQRQVLRLMARRLACAAAPWLCARARRLRRLVRARLRTGEGLRHRAAGADAAGAHLRERGARGAAGRRDRGGRLHLPRRGRSVDDEHQPRAAALEAALDGLGQRAHERPRRPADADLRAHLRAGRVPGRAGRGRAVGAEALRRPAGSTRAPR